MSFQLIESGCLYDASEAPLNERIAFVCGLYRTPAGTLLASCQLASAKSAPDAHLGLFRSRDDGRSWHRLPAALPTSFQGVVGSLAGGEITEVAPGKLILVSTWYDRSDPARPLFDPETEGLLKSKMLKAFSTDEGETWSAWEEIPLHGLTGTAVSGGLLSWSDGSIGIAFESFKHFDELETKHQAAWILRSTDGGQSFPELSLVATDPSGAVSYWDQRLCATAEPGGYLGLFWTHDRQLQTDLTVHAKRGVCGTDRAASLPHPTGIEGQISAALTLPDGRALACVIKRNRPATISLWASPDGGLTWPETPALVVYNHEEKARLTQGASDIDFAAYWEDMGRWTFGHPAMQLLANGDLVIIYYAGSPGSLSLHWSIVTEIKS